MISFEPKLDTFRPRENLVAMFTSVQVLVIQETFTDEDLQEELILSFPENLKSLKHAGHWTL